MLQYICFARVPIPTASVRPPLVTHFRRYDDVLSHGFEGFADIQFIKSLIVEVCRIEIIDSRVDRFAQQVAIDRHVLPQRHTAEAHGAYPQVRFAELLHFAWSASRGTGTGVAGCTDTSSTSKINGLYGGISCPAPRSP